jgi:hypothetical protein
MGMEPMVSGNRQLQQMSVMGFMKRPWQVLARAGVTPMTARMRASISGTQTDDPDKHFLGRVLERVRAGG